MASCRTSARSRPLRRAASPADARARARRPLARLGARRCASRVIDGRPARFLVDTGSLKAQGSVPAGRLGPGGRPEPGAGLGRRRIWGSTPDLGVSARIGGRGVPLDAPRSPPTRGATPRTPSRWGLKGAKGSPRRGWCGLGAAGTACAPGTVGGGPAPGAGWRSPAGRPPPVLAPRHGDAGPRRRPRVSPVGGRGLEPPTSSV